MRRILLGALVLAVALAVARGPSLRPVFRSDSVAGAREMLVYRLAGAPARFAIPEGQRVLRVLTNLDLPEPAPDEGIEYAVRVRIVEDARDETYPLLALARRRADGAPAAFTLGGPAPAWTREIVLSRPQTTPAVLEVSLVAPRRAHAAVRVLGSARRTALAASLLASRTGPLERTRLALGRGPIDWDELPPELQTELLTEHWARLPAAPGTTSGRLYIAGEPAPLPRESAEPGEPVTAGQVLAYTLRGPGTVRLGGVGTALTGAVEILAASGKARTLPLALAAGEPVDVPLEAGLVTLRVRARGDARVTAIVSDARIAIPGTRLEARPGGAWDVRPSWGFERDPMTAAGAPVAYDLRGRAGAELRLTARGITRCGAAATDLVLRWTMRDAQRKAVASGTLRRPVEPACEDRLEHDPAAVPTEPAALYLWPPPQATSLELDADRAIVVGVSSPAFAAPRDEAAPAGVVARGLPRDRPLWMRVHPRDEDDLERAGRLERLRVAVRLERHPPPAPPSQIADTLAPVDHPPRLTVLVPAKADAELPDAGAWWPLPAGARTQLEFALPKGAGPLARARWNLLYLGDQRTGRGAATVRIDGATVAELPLYTARGQLALPPVAAGRRSVEVDVAPGTRLYVDQPRPGTLPLRSFGVYELREGGRSVLALAKGATPRALGVALYFEGEPRRTARIEVTIDGGVRRAPPAHSSLQRTRLARALPVAATALLDAAWLDRPGGRVFAAPPMFFGLGDDIPAGQHRIALSIVGSGVRAFARFFSYGATLRAERIATFGETRSLETWEQSSP